MVVLEGDQAGESQSTYVVMTVNISDQFSMHSVS